MSVAALPPGWFQRQADAAIAAVSAWPDWKKREAGIDHLFPSTERTPVTVAAIKDAVLAPDGEETGRLNVRNGVRDFLVGAVRGSVFVWLDKVIESASDPHRCDNANCRGMLDEARHFKRVLSDLIRPATIYVPDALARGN